MRAQPVTGRDGEDHAARQFFVKRRSAPLNGREMLRHGELRGAQRRLTLHGGDGTDA